VKRPLNRNSSSILGVLLKRASVINVSSIQAKPSEKLGLSVTMERLLGLKIPFSFRLMVII